MITTSYMERNRGRLITVKSVRFVMSELTSMDFVHAALVGTKTPDINAQFNFQLTHFKIIGMIVQRQRYVKHPEFNGLGEIVWKYLNSEGRIASEIMRSHNQKLNPTNNDHLKQPVWHTKTELDKFVEKNLHLRLSDYGKDLSRNPLYKAIAGEIRYFRKKGIIVDLYQTESNFNKGIWRLADNSAVKSLVSDEMAARNFHSSGELTTVFVREKQREFKKILFNQYHVCLFCKFNLEKWMRGAHIVPYNWMRKHDPHNSMNPENGLLLCSACDVAFEHGYILVEKDYGITITEHLQESRNTAVRSWLENIQTEMCIDKDILYRPNVEYLKRKKILVTTNH